MSTAAPTASELPALPGTPLMLGDHPALDFLNSVFTPAGVTLDFLRDGGALRDWLAHADALPAATREAVAAMSPGEADRLAADARALREGLRRLLFARAASGRAPDTDALAFINLALSRSPLVQRLQTDDAGGCALALRRDRGGPDGVMADFAALCAQLLAEVPPAQVRKCENPSCTLWFNDAKRGPRRRWCSMSLCGNRMKVAAHRARHKPAPK